jgi:hypothetical protein
LRFKDELSIMTSRHHPRKRVIQYAAAVVHCYERRGVLDRPVKPGDDGFVARRAYKLSPKPHLIGGAYWMPPALQS